MAISSVVQSASQTARDEVRQAANALATVVANLAHTSAAVATATVTSQVKTTASLTYKTDGAFRTAVGATDNFWTLAGATVPVASYQKYYLLVDSAGAASVAQGVPASTAAGVVLPAPPQGKCIAGVLTVATDATHTFIPGTTLLGATGITATYVNGFDASTLSTIVLG